MRYDAASAEALMRRTPLLLSVLLDGLDPAWLDAPEGPGAWSPREVASHMADLERDAWIPRVRALLRSGTREPLPAVEPERFRATYADAPIGTVLDDFRRFRSANLRELVDLAPDEATLAGRGRHHRLGEVRLSELLSTWAVHDLTHLSQICRALAAQYRGEVGPWAAYLSVLRPRAAEAGPPGAGRAERPRSPPRSGASNRDRDGAPEADPPSARHGD